MWVHCLPILSLSPSSECVVLITLPLTQFIPNTIFNFVIVNFIVATLLGMQEEDEETTVKIESLGCEEGGIVWDDRVHSTIRGLLINHNQWIGSIQVEYIQNGKSRWGSKHGRDEPSFSESQVVLDYPNEYLISFRGHYGYTNDWGKIANGIRSLTLITNRKTYGPFGVEEGTKFLFPIMGAKIVGFHGRYSSLIEAIGVYIQPISKNQLNNFSLGPFGAKGGQPWQYVCRSIRRFVVNHEQWIYSIQMQYEDKKGKLVCSDKHGEKDGRFISEVEVEFPDEHFVSIHGYYNAVIRSLTFETNRRIFGPYGVEEGTKFSFPIVGTKIVGVYGRSGFYLNAIGLYLETITQETNVEVEPASAPVPRFELEPCKLSQYGGNGGDVWEDTFWSIRRLVIYHGLWIDSIQIQYEDDYGNLKWSTKHGGNGGSRSEVSLEFPNEYLVSIHGYYTNFIQSLTLETNMKSYGPFGVEKGSKFSFPNVGVNVVGIHGRSGTYLDAIGLYVVSTQE